MDNPKQTARMAAFLLPLVLFGMLFFFRADVARAGEKPLYPGYPLTFDGRAHWDGMADGYIILSDSRFKLAPGATFHFPDGSSSGPSGFARGDWVGFLLNREGQIESLWLIRKKAKKK